MSDPSIDIPDITPLPMPPKGKKLRLEVIPLDNVHSLPGKVMGVSAAEATPHVPTRLNNAFLRPDPKQAAFPATGLTQDELIQLESQLRSLALANNDRILLGLNAQPVVETGKGRYMPFMAAAAPQDSDFVQVLLGGGSKGGIYQLTSFPIKRFNGVPLPPDSRIRFADPTRWFHKGQMESRLFTISVDGTKKYYSWDAHAQVGNKPHNFYHVNQKGMYQIFGHSNHANLAGAELAQAKQLRYLKIGGRVFLVVGVVVDTVQLSSAAYESYEQESIRPVAAQTVRTVGGWTGAWLGVKAGVVVGGVAGIETGPGAVLTAIGGGIVGGTAGYFGADWIADWIYED